VPRDFQLQVFFIRALSIFLKIYGDISSSSCTTGVVDTGGKKKKSLIREVLIIFLVTFG
jgi:hypothetical protein